MSEKFACIGAGLIGSSWAMSFARSGHRVALFDDADGAAERALGLIRDRLGVLQSEGLLEDAEHTAALITAADSLEEAVAGASFVQESVFEDVALKQSVYAKLDQAAEPDAVLASSTSAILPDAFLGDIRGRDRAIIAHPANPPYLLPVVELVRSSWTSDDTVARCSAVMESVGQVPVVLKKAIAGFVMNRLQAALIQEAMFLVGEGYVDPEGVDKVVRHSLGLRWSFMGPFEVMDSNAPAGFRDYAARYGPSTIQEIGRSIDALGSMRYRWPQPIIDEIDAWRRSEVPAGKLDHHRRWRDLVLMQLAQVMARARAGKADI
jgi:L-gulonate 3-dehydrogenase